ncbi:MAG: transcriptional repressor [Deltaproteobacteria bacterium]|nr:transcriptional repressor [Deltaproteobacteria bacterium]
MSEPASRFDRLREAKARLRAYLRDRGLRSSRQREAVLEAFLAEDAHVSVDELYDRLRPTHPSLSPSTVYRSMALFVNAGIAKERRFHGERVRYEPGIGVDHHDHLVCLDCGRIEEFEDPTIERLQQEIARSRGFVVRFHRLELYGLCGRCRADPKKNSSQGVDTDLSDPYKGHRNDDINRRRR